MEVRLWIHARSESVIVWHRRLSSIHAAILLNSVDHFKNNLLPVIGFITDNRESFIPGFFFPLTTPLEDTVAIFLLLDLKVIFVAGTAVAMSVAFFPFLTVMVALPGFTAVTTPFEDTLAIENPILDVRLTVHNTRNPFL